MRLATANLGRGVDVPAFTRNLTRVLDAAGPRAVICLQEIDEADKPEEAIILRRLVRDTHRIIGAHTAVPILVPYPLELISARLTHGCDGLALFTPARVINEATIALAPDLIVGVLNTHLPINRPETTTRRRDVRRVLRRRANAHAAGVWAADTNTRQGWPAIRNGERPVIAAGIDRARAWAPDQLGVVVSDRRTVPLHIDGHDAHIARVMWQ